MKKVIFVLLIAAAITAYGQQEEVLQKAFADSYRYEQQADYRAAVAVLQEAYQPDSYEINLRLGWLYYLLGDYPQSLKYYKVAMTLLPYSIEARLGYVLPLAAMGNWNEVVGIYESILQTDPQNTLANYRLGVIYYERGEYGRAKTYVEKVVNLYPFDYDSVLLLGWINLQMKDYRKAQVLFNKSLLIRPGDASARAGLQQIK
ncbi:MAG TPA: tetratricopeptide repeat protein [Flammeovirgaceae bacterium]|nr:tetratricopeptide repeat protein [Flammeovirgaceae bacterium]